MPEDAALVRLRAVTKTFGAGKASRKALDAVSIEVAPREFVTVVGPSGSGKSTLLAVIGGLDLAFEGRVEVLGQDIATLSDKALARLRAERIGFVFQAFHLLSHVTVLENVLAPALFLPSGDHVARAKELLERVGLGDRGGDTPGSLSGGQRQRVAIARALLARPTLLLCDEPTGNLDRATGERIVELFSELHREEGLTVVAVTHEPRLAAAATRVIELEDGHVANTKAAS